ncbi:uncharacterized protein [Drosophila suzukii]
MFFEKDNIVFDKDENETGILDFDIYENERQGKRYPYPFFLEDKWNSTDDDFSTSCPAPTHITHQPVGAHTRTSTTQATSAEDLATPICAEPIICDSSSGDGDDVVAIQNPIIPKLKESASASVAHTHSRKRRRLERHSTHAPSTPEIIKQLLPFEMFRAAYTSSDTNQIELEEDRSVISSVSASTTCATTKESRIAEVSSDADPSFGEIEFLNIDQFVNTDTSNSTSNTSIIEAENADIVEGDRSAEEENRTESASSYCGESNSETRFSDLLSGHASPVHPVASTSQIISSHAGENNVTRKRGRPAKDHADGPDPKRMLRMNKRQRKAYEDRIKNNEASRLSRRKKKKSEEEEKKTEEDLAAENLRLRELADKVACQERKLKKFLSDTLRRAPV